ncbi:hypothetical protein NMY22_g16714 [Coprinellus aureogranulatus]|nr:hypothetical protein NMY22_g16714 [Coprinellus aureogranulatus]
MAHHLDFSLPMRTGFSVYGRPGDVTTSQTDVPVLASYTKMVGVQALPRMDPWMYETYWGLPELQEITLVPHDNGNPPVLDTFSASTVRSIYCGKRTNVCLFYSASPSVRRIYTALTTVGFDVFINPSRARPDRVEAVFEYGVMYYRIPRRLHEPGLDCSPKNVCFFSTGVAAYSHLTAPYTSTHGGRTIEDRRLGIYPVELEYQRALAFLGTAANKCALRFGFSGGALHFVTRTKEFSERNSNNSTMSDASFLGMHSDGDQHDAILNILTQSFPHALNFNCYIPIFDARHPAFAFDRSNFQSLFALPLFHGELPHGALVTVGYTTCIFHEPGSDPERISDDGVSMFFVQFIILHSL